MAVPKRKSSRVKFKYSVFKKELQRKVKTLNIKNLNNNLNRYKRKCYW